MADLTASSRDGVEDAELQSLIAEADRLGVPDTAVCRMLARVPDHGKPMLRAMLVSHQQGNVDHRLKEMVRIRLARIAGDARSASLRSRRAREAGLDEAAIEAACGDFERDDRFSAAEKAALRYATDMYGSPETVDQAFYAGLKRHFTEAQIMELGAFIALHYGIYALLRTMAPAGALFARPAAPR